MNGLGVTRGLVIVVTLFVVSSLVLACSAETDSSDGEEPAAATSEDAIHESCSTNSSFRAPQGTCRPGYVCQRTQWCTNSYPVASCGGGTCELPTTPPPEPCSTNSLHPAPIGTCPWGKTCQHTQWCTNSYPVASCGGGYCL